MLTTKDLILRDITEEDLARHLYWETIENEWQLWDGPWEYEGLSEAERLAQAHAYVEKLRRRMEQLRALPPDAPRTTFHIAEKSRPEHAIGWVSSYAIDDDFTYTTGAGHRAVGIDIPDMQARGKGYGAQALGAFVAYLLDTGLETVYLQTWSGNERMVHLAEKLGFEACCRKKELRLVRGQRYDSLTFRLNVSQFHKVCKTVLNA